MIHADALDHSLNQRSWALIIGIDRYKNNALPPLETAERGAHALAHLLHHELGFPKNQIVTLTNQEATREAIQAMVTDYFTDPRTIGEDDRLLVYYAGHGLTRTPQNGGEKVGYLAPYDCETGRWSTFVEMDLLERQAGFMPARHVLFLLDACFSGLAMTRGSHLSLTDPIQDIMTRPSRRVITAGSEDQPTSDRLGHERFSAFTYFLLEGLRGHANHNGLLRGEWLGLYIREQVRKHSVGRQTPQTGKLLGDKGGDFVFRISTQARMEVWMQQALSSASPQERLKAAYELWETADSHDDPAMVEFAYKTLQNMQYDSDPFVQDAVKKALEKLQIKPDPGQQPTRPSQPTRGNKPTHEKTTRLSTPSPSRKRQTEDAATLPHREEDITQAVSLRELAEAPTLLSPPGDRDRLREQQSNKGRRFWLW